MMIVIMKDKVAIYLQITSYNLNIVIPLASVKMIVLVKIFPANGIIPIVRI